MRVLTVTDVCCAWVDVVFVGWRVLFTERIVFIGWRLSFTERLCFVPRAPRSIKLEYIFFVFLRTRAQPCAC